MSQHDLDITTADANSGITFRAQLNDALKALGTMQSGATAPSTTYAYQYWADTTTGLLKQRNAANTDWIIKATLADPAETDIASATTTAIGGVASDNVRITGTTTITSFGTANAGVSRRVRFAGALTLTHHATSLILPGAANITTAAGDTFEALSLGAGDWVVRDYMRANGQTLRSHPQILPVTASVASNNLTVALNPTVLDFRSATLGSGAVNTHNIDSAISMVVASGQTLGTINGVQSRLAVIAIDNAGTVELAVHNIAGGANLDETTLISTTAIGGSAGNPALIYSTTARSNVPFRVVGYVESTQATAGTWATAPSTIQGYGGQAFAAMSSLGYGQTWQNVAGSRASGTTYYNTTAKPIMVCAGSASPGGSVIGVTIIAVVGGVPVANPGTYATHTYPNVAVIVPAFTSYSLTFLGTGIGVWAELR